MAFAFREPIIASPQNAVNVVVLPGYNLIARRCSDTPGQLINYETSVLLRQNVLVVIRKDVVGTYFLSAYVEFLKSKY